MTTDAEKYFLGSYGSRKHIDALMSDVDKARPDDHHMQTHALNVLRNPMSDKDLNTKIFKKYDDTDAIPRYALMFHSAELKHYPRQMVDVVSSPHFDKDPAIGNFVRNPHLTHEDLNRIAKSAGPSMEHADYREIIQHPNATVETSIAGSMNPDYHKSVSAVDTFKDHTPESLTRLWHMHQDGTNSPNPELTRFAIVKQKNLPPEISVHAALHDPSPMVRITAMSNQPSIPIETLRHIRDNDPDVSIKNVANRVIEKRENQTS